MCHRFIVKGRVQGVFFRASARDIAVKIGLNGWVKNLNDGSVESLACGDAKQIEEYRRWLNQGPKFANVTTVEELVVTCSVQSSFEIT